MKKLTYAVPAALVALTLAGAGVASAQSAYTYNGTAYNVPAGYTYYAYGIYRNAAAGVYYDPVTGQVSTTPPTGPASFTSSSYIIPAGYAPYNYGIYYNSSTGMYYDPRTGQTSTIAPIGSASVPAGYTNATSYGTYYDPTTAQYFDPTAGFTSSMAPSGPTYNTLTTYRAPSGLVYAIPAGYSPSTFGTYFDASTGLYLDPVSGFTSTSAATGPVYYQANSSAGLPNTGAGGEAPLVALALAGALALALGAVTFVTRRAR